MPQVWYRIDPTYRTRFHRSPDCRQLKKKPSRGTKHELVCADLEDVHVRPCQTCYPDAPKISILKKYCPICRTANACEHNGGVQIIDRSGRHYWVWPDTNQMPFYRMTS